MVTERDVRKFAEELNLVITRLSKVKWGFVDRAARWSLKLQGWLQRGGRRELEEWKRGVLVSGMSLVLKSVDVPKWLENRTIGEIVELATRAQNLGYL